MTDKSSFFEKLRKGMGIEGPIEEKMEVEEKPKPRKEKVKKPKELKIETKPVPSAPLKPTAQKKFKIEAKKIEVNQLIAEKDYTSPPKKEEKKKWFEPEGQLAIDVYQTKNELVIQSAIAGVKSENLDISMEGDVIIIKGRREKVSEEEGNYFTKECYWGPFSREIILPVEVDPGRIEATMKEGILTIRIPKILRERRKKIIVKGK
jgi:HSP20 family protein